MNTTTTQTETKPEERRALIVDRDPRATEQVREALQRMGVRVSTADSLPGALTRAELWQPDLLICDVDLGQRHLGLHLAQTVRSRWNVSIVFMSARVERDILDAVASTECCGIVCKPLQRQQLDATLRFAFHRRAFETNRRTQFTRRREDHRRTELEVALRQIATLVLRAGVAKPESDDQQRTVMLSSLRPREQEVVQLLLQNYRVPAIAQRLGITPQTVRNHLKAVYRRIGARSQQEVVDRFRQAPTSVTLEPDADSVDVSTSPETAAMAFEEASRR